MQLLVTTLPFLLGSVLGEDGSQGWLRYAPAAEGCESQQVPSAIVALNSTKVSPVYTAGQELQKGLKSILGKDVDVTTGGSSNLSAIIIGTVDAYTTGYGSVSGVEELEDDGYLLSTDADSVVILGRNERGALYGAFEYLSQVARNNLTSGSYVSNPQAPIRWTNEWDNMDGSIERGYGGASNFFRGGYVVDNTTRAAEYARLLASVGINGVIVNNVNANATLLSDRNVEGLGRLADAMRPYGVQLGISLNFASPNATLGTFDPLDPKVDAWWANITDQIYKKVSINSIIRDNVDSDTTIGSGYGRLSSQGEQRGSAGPTHVQPNARRWRQHVRSSGRAARWRCDVQSLCI
jgi:alpha-glucuronidase